MKTAFLNHLTFQEINIKDYIDLLQNPTMRQNQCRDNGSGKSNIILMNPELHLHKNDQYKFGDTSDPNNDERIKVRGIKLFVILTLNMFND